MTKYLYHFKREGMHGDILYPLNTLKHRLPEKYAKESAKYAGREKIMEKQIPGLNCLWNDVLHLSPVNPRRILDAMKRENLEWALTKGTVKREVFRIPIELIKPENAIYFQNLNFHSDPDPWKEEFWKYWTFDPKTYQEQADVTPEQIRVWRKKAALNQPLLLFSNTVHILVKQEINISGCEIFSCG